jgi:hypothetical protein
LHQGLVREITKFVKGLKIAKYGGGSNESRMLYTEEDLERSMDKIEVI